MAPTETTPGRLAGLSDDGVLAVLLEAVRRVLVEDGVPARIRRRGYGRVSVEVVVRDFRVHLVDVGSRATSRGDGG